MQENEAYADDSTVNSQVVDSVNTSNTVLLGNSPSQSMSMINAVLAETLGMGMYNAISAQQNAQMIGTASTTATCAKILNIIPGTLIPGPSGPVGPAGPQGAPGEPGRAAERARGPIRGRGRACSSPR